MFLNLKVKLLDNKYLLLFFISYLFIWGLVSLNLDIHPDSLDHWGWSQKLAFGYHSNAPMIAYWMKLSSFIISNKVAAIKIGGIFSSALVLFAAYLAAREFLNKKEALLYILILHSTFYYSLLSQFWTIEQPYNFFWFLCLWSFGKYLNSKKKRWLLFLGVFGGLGAMSKYIIVIFCLILVIWLLWDKKHRNLLFNPYFLLAGGIALLIFSPVIYWNYQKDWVSFRFVLDKGIEQKWVWQNLISLQAAHLFFYAIFFSLPAWFLLCRKKFVTFFESSKFSFLVIHSIAPILFFSYSSFKGKLADPNWLNGSYISLYILLARYIYQNKAKIYYFLLGFANFSIISFTVFFILFQKYQFSFVPKNLTERFNEINGWQQITQQTQNLLTEKKIVPPNYIITKHYQNGAALAFYLANNPKYYVTQREERELVTKKEVTKNKALVFIRDTVPEDKNKIQKIFPQKWIYLGEVEALVAKKQLHKFQLWLKE